MAEQRPNIIILMADNLRYDCLGVSPEKRLLKTYRVDHLLETPMLDRLCAQGVYFSQAISSATETPPSTASMLTGCRGPVHNVRVLYGGPVPPQVKTLWEHVSPAGYDTAACDAHTFMEFNGSLRDCRKVLKSNWKTERHTDLLKQINAELKPPFALYMHLWDVHRPYALSAFPYKRHQAAMDFLSRFLDEYDLPRPKVPLERLGADALRDLWMDLWQNYFHTGLANPVESQFPQYVAGVSAFDQGRLTNIIRYFERAGILENSILCIISDHGETVDARTALFEPVFVHSCFPNEGVMRVPLILHAPGRLPEGVTVPQQVSSVDLLPTLLELAGVEPLDSPMHGRSLVPAANGKDDADSVAYCELGITHPRYLMETFQQECEQAQKNLEFEWLIYHRALRTPQYKYIEAGEPVTDADLALPDRELIRVLWRKQALAWTDSDDFARYEQALLSGQTSREALIRNLARHARAHIRCRLFDIQNDPDETANLLGLDPQKYNAVAEPMRGALMDIYEQTTDPGHSTAQHGEHKAEDIRDMADHLRGFGYID